MKEKIKLAVVDDQLLFRKGLIALLNEFDAIDIIMESSGGRELMVKLETQKPDVILLDLEMPDVDGFKTTQLLRQKYPEIKILILTMHNENGIIQHLIQNGAHGFLLKDNDIEVIVEGIHSVLENGYYFNDHVSKEMVKNLINEKSIKPNFKKTVLSQREIEIIRLICMEYTNKEISNKLFISVRTVGAHRENIFRKINAKNVIGIVMYAVKNKLLETE
ncbi:MAG: response regulator transcription factor [Bacteroidetes bacterium]|nr:response regulator transcription factor [Bacteroidota bacterium]